MTDDIEVFVQKFQEEMLQEARERYGETFFRRWQNPLYLGKMDGADAVAGLKGTCGDNMVIYLKFENGRVRAASFQTDGCAPSIVCGSYAAELSMGKDPEELLDLNAQTIIDRLGHLPEAVQHCAFLAASTVHQAVDNYMALEVTRDRSGRG